MHVGNRRHIAARLVWLVHPTDSVSGCSPSEAGDGLLASIAPPKTPSCGVEATAISGRSTGKVRR